MRKGWRLLISWNGAVFVVLEQISAFTVSASEAFSFKHLAVEGIRIFTRLAFMRQNPSLAIDLFQGGIGDKVSNMELVTGIGNLGQTHIMRDKDAKHGESILPSSPSWIYAKNSI